MERVRAAMEQLSPDYREVLVLREMEGLSLRRSPPSCRCRSAP